MVLFAPQRTVRYTLIGTACIVIGCTGIYGYFSNDLYRLAFQSDLALGIFNVILGILLIVRQSAPELFPYAVSILMLIDGGNKVQISLESMVFGLKR